jgi:hypothetical protein
VAPSMVKTAGKHSFRTKLIWTVFIIDSTVAWCRMPGARLGTRTETMERVFFKRNDWGVKTIE